MGTEVSVKERTGGIYTQEVSARGHKIYGDEPESMGSADLGLTPFEFVLAGLGSCTTITLRMYADRKKWPVTDISCDVRFKKSGADGKLNVFIRKIKIEGELDEAQRARMLQIADKCPVHRMLEGETEIRTELA